MDKICYLHLCTKYSKHPCFQSGNPCESVGTHLFASSYESMFESQDNIPDYSFCHVLALIISLRI
jgi:hypothetical protein